MVVVGVGSFHAAMVVVVYAAQRITPLKAQQALCLRGHRWAGCAVGIVVIVKEVTETNLAQARQGEARRPPRP